MKKILYRADAANIEEIGTGHIVRGLAIARLLEKKYNFEFISRGINEYKIIEKFYDGKTKFNIINIEKNNTKEESDEINKIKCDLIIVDRLKTTKSFIERIKNEKKVIVFDDTGSGGQYADAQINALLYRGEVKNNEYRGFDYLILNEYKTKKLKRLNNVIKFFVSFGGYDHRKISLLIYDIF